jgi:dolichol-phosphate mannosyltransferase
LDVVVIATYNECETIETIIRQLSYPVIIVDDSSPDGTGEIARCLGATVISRPPKSGIASAYYDGFKSALQYKPDYIIQMDAGLTHNPKDVNRLLIKARNGYDLVIGSRNFGLGKRALLSRTAALMMRLKGIDLPDVTSGFRCWQGDLLQTVVKEPFKSRYFAFQLEALYRAYQAKAEIGIMPIEYKLTNSSFKMKMVKEALRIWLTLK